MNNPNNLFNMMQTGGLTSTAGGTALARALQRQSDVKKLERQQRAEAKRQKRGGLFGSIGSLAGGLLGAALAPVTGGVSLALASGLGAGLGRRVGEGLGAGKSRKYDREGTVFGQQAFRDVEQASRDYTRGMGERALTSGLQTALSAYLNPTGMYGKVQGKLRKPTGFDVNPAFSMPSSYGAEIAGDIDMTASNAEMANLLEEQVAGEPIVMGLTDRYSDNLQIKRQPISKFKPNVNMPSKNLIGMVKDFASKNLYSNRGNEIKRGLARLYGMGGDEFATRTTARGRMDNPFLQLEEADSLYDLYETDSSPSVQDAMMALSGKVNQYNSPLGFQDGGYTAERILQESGFEPTEEQLGMFQQFDPGDIERAKERTEQSLLSMTGGMGLSSMGGGFGARQRAATSAIGRGEDLIGDVAEQTQKGYESQVFGTMADLIASGAEFGEKAENKTYVPTNNPSWNPPVVSNEGAVYSFNGKNYYWDGNEWVTEYVRSEDIRAQYDDGNDGYGGS
mgnify:CR=1 FL=1